MLKTIFTLLIAFCVFANAGQLSLTAENDVFAKNNTDHNYSHGSKITYSSDYVPTLFGLYEFSDKFLVGESNKFDFTIGQYMYTPDDINATELIVDDRPYAGVLYGEFAYMKYDHLQLSRLGYMIGVVGPASYAQETQTWIHEMTDSDIAQGWDNQLNNELLLDVSYQYKLRLLKERYGDIIGHCGGAVGTAHTYANGGLEMRLGYNVPDDFGRALAEPLPRLKKSVFSLYTMAGIDARAVAWNITLDGNIFSDSHSVEKEPFVADMYLGIGSGFGRFHAEYYYTYRTEEFIYQDGIWEYGTIMLKFDF